MEKYKVIRYQSENYAQWNAFVARAKNATFLFHRDFMSYHQDRFEDYSLLVFDAKDKIKALLPAHRKANALYSHYGLSYGGLVIDQDLKLDKYLLLFKTLLQFLHDAQFSTLYLKPIPQFYCTSPAEEINYVLHLVQAHLYRVDSSTTIDLRAPFTIDKCRMEGVKKAQKLGLQIKQETDFTSFWNTVLVPNLQERHQLQPVHRLDEIQHLHALFPQQILQFNCYHAEQLLAGATLFVNNEVVHVQYISGIGNKNQHGALDYLFYELITSVFKDYHFFDFGNSNEQNGTQLNQGLHFWKEGFGARTFVHYFYSLPTHHFNYLDHVILKK